jgi:uncharacterized protein (DUF1330 family)
VHEAQPDRQRNTLENAILKIEGDSSMPKAYWVVTYRSITNHKAWESYAEIAKPAIAAAGGRFLALAQPAKIYEAGMDQRVVLVEFNSIEEAIACHDTPAYQEALRILGKDNVERDLRIIEGMT